jgi:hypothetical protein
MMMTTKEGRPMTKVAAGITTSLDGYIAGPNDGPGRGLGDGGERLHYWVFGGPWSYEEEPRGEAMGPGGKRLFDDFDETMTLEHLGLLQSLFATHITYRVVR